MPQHLQVLRSHRWLSSLDGRKLQYRMARRAKAHREGLQEIGCNGTLGGTRLEESPDYSCSSPSFVSGTSSSKSSAISSASSDSGLASPICDSSRPKGIWAVSGYLEMTNRCELSWP